MSEIDEIREKIADYLWQYRDNPPAHDLEVLRRARQILSHIKVNGYSIWEMIKFFSKIDRETQREAVVRKKGELPYVDPHNFESPLDVRLGLDMMLNTGYVQEVRQEDDNVG